MTIDLLKDLPYLDPNRTGIWGWSYGGYATLMTLIQVVELICLAKTQIYNMFNLSEE